MHHVQDIGKQAQQFEVALREQEKQLSHAENELEVIILCCSTRHVFTNLIGNLQTTSAAAVPGSRISQKKTKRGEGEQ
jgi:hypothetical protein